MAEIVREEVPVRRRGINALGWLALAIAIIALIIAWLAYNRSGTDLETRIQTEVNKAIENKPEVNVTPPNVEVNPSPNTDDR